VLYSTTDDDTGLTDLHIYMTSNGSDTVVRNAIKGAQYQFLTGSETTLLYFLNSSSGSNMYSLDTTSNAETQLTNYSGAEGVEAVYQQGGYIFYQTNKGLYIMSFSSPKRNKLVTTSIVRYTGYDF
jgi:Tol biopolymer transport system component